MVRGRGAIPFPGRLIGVVRAERAFVAAHAFPEHAVGAVAVSELLSALSPLLDVRGRGLTLAIAFAMAYTPRSTEAVLDLYVRETDTRLLSVRNVRPVSRRVRATLARRGSGVRMHRMDGMDVNGRRWRRRCDRRLVPIGDECVQASRPRSDQPPRAGRVTDTTLANRAARRRGCGRGRSRSGVLRVA